MIPRRTARNTRHAIALDSAKYTEPSIGFISPGTEGARMRAVDAIATPIVTLQKIWVKPLFIEKNGTKTTTDK
jgi:hypothetical protein